MQRLTERDGISVSEQVRRALRIVAQGKERSRQVGSTSRCAPAQHSNGFGRGDGGGRSGNWNAFAITVRRSVSPAGGVNMGSIYRQKNSKKWWIKYYVNGRPHRESSQSEKETE